jgi:hypothetical protein
VIASVLTAPRGPFAFVLLVVAGLVIAGAMIVMAPRDHALIAKAVWRSALALHGVTHAQLAALLGVTTAAVDAALSDARDNTVPMWWLMHPAVPEAVRSYVLTEIAARTSAPRATDDSPEALTQAALVRVGHLVTTLGALLTPGTAWRIGVDAAAQALRQIGDTVTTLRGLSARLQRRVITGSLPAAKGGSR